MINIGDFKVFNIHTDGSCGPTNPGNMGLGITINCTSEESSPISISMHAGPGTNNRAELLAAIMALRAVLDDDSAYTIVTIHSDSNYVVKGISKWIYTWIKDKRMGLGASTVKNVDLWRALYNLKKKFYRVTFKWNKGHNGIVENEVVDKLAKKGYLEDNPDIIKQSMAKIFDEKMREYSSTPLYPNRRKRER